MAGEGAANADPGHLVELLEHHRIPESLSLINMTNTLELVDQSKSPVDGAPSPAAATNQYIIDTALCRCHRPFAGDEGTGAAAEIDSIHSIHGEIACMRISAHESPSNETSSTPLNNDRSIPPSGTLLQPSSSSGTFGTATKEWKERVDRRNLQELCIHCFLSNFFPDFSEGAYMSRINSLPMLTEEPFKFTRRSQHSAFPTRENWPVGLEKSAYWLSLTEVLNEILDQFNLNDGESVRFITYDRPMASANPQSLKPGMFLVEDKFVSLDLLKWKHPIAALEVSSNFWDALRQLSTYTRELLNARPGRQVCWAFHFDHIGSKFRVILFTPDSVHYSQPAIIANAAGYRDVVKLVVALLSQPGLLTIGEDSSRDSRIKILPNGDKLEMLGVEFDRKQFIGRRTRIMSAVVIESGNTAMEYERPSAEDDDYVLKKMQKNPYETITFADNRDHLKVGEHLIIKESWPLASRGDVEWSALTSCLNEFGLPEVVYRVTGKHPIPGAYTQNPRVPQQLALREKGLDLREASSPRILLTAVLHAIVGHWNLFQKGWLHRDVSIGNVLILRDPVQKLEPVGLDWQHGLTKCQGMLIDGDAMIHQDLEREPGIQRLCTVSFLSFRLASAWAVETETFDQYFDDLESFAWVLLWALIEIAQANNRATTFDRQLIESLSGNNLLSLKTAKGSIVRDFKTLSGDIAEDLPKVHSTSLLDPFIIILDHWFGLVDAKRRCGNAGTLPSSEESMLFYKDFITFAMEKMNELPEVWKF